MIGAGQTIGNYRVLNKIGTGGMGAVYLAEHPLIGKKVALKVIHRELAGNREVVQRFFQEAKAVNKIGNEHIVEIHDFGVTPEGDHFYIMEYLEGQNLASLLGHETVLDVMRSLHIGAQVASALAAAHACGVIHRDLKPDNVMLTMRLGDPDFVKLLDFGLAKMFAGSSLVKTAAGVLLGTPQYMSPEACESKPGMDHRTDIYALGILLFQMMTGKLPFDGESMGEVLVKQVTQLPPPPRGFNPSIPPSVEQIVLRCLAKSPDARFPTMTALREALMDPERYLDRSPPMAPARSMAPGESPVDAKTIMAYAAQQTKIGLEGGPLPLPAPAMTMPGAGPASGAAAARTMISDGTLVPPKRPPTQGMDIRGPDMARPMAPKTNTMRIATPLGYSSRGQRKMWPIVLVFGLLLGLGGGAFAVAWFGRKGDAVATNGSGSAGSAAVKTSGKGSAAVVKAGSATVTPIVTPVGSGSGSATATGTGSATPPGTGTATGSASGSGSGSGSGSKVTVVPVGVGSAQKPGVGSGSAVKVDAPVTAIVVIDSAPQGAEVFGPDKKSLGKTPAKLTLPVSNDFLTFELRLAGYRKKTKELRVSGNTVVQVPLEKLPAVYVPSGTPHHGTGKGSGKGSDSDLMRPDDL